MIPEFIPSPSTGVWYLGPLPVRAYALCIIAGAVVAVVVGRRRWRARGGNPETIESVAMLGIPLGIIGARLYHVITDYELYFGPGKHPIDALKIWNGGLGIWGAVALGAVGALIVCRRRGASFAAVADACAPGIVLAQGIGRVGNYFNQELFGRPTTLPWGLEIAPAHRPVGYEQYATFHPTFLYELIWDLLTFAVLLWVDRRFKLGRGKVFVLYVVIYTFGRFWVESLRIDTVNRIHGFRLNDYTSAIVFVISLAFLIYLFWRRPGREHDVERARVAERAAPDASSMSPDASLTSPDASSTDDAERGTADRSTADRGTAGSETAERVDGVDTAIVDRPAAVEPVGSGGEGADPSRPG